MSNELRALKEALLTHEQLAKLKARLVKRLVQIGDCWIYRGTRNSANYGTFRVGKRVMTASRFALCMATNTPLDHPAQAGHVRTCTSSACCNPNHLFWIEAGKNLEQREREREERKNPKLVPWLWPKWTPENKGNPEPPTNMEHVSVAVPMWMPADVIGSRSVLSRHLLSRN